MPPRRANKELRIDAACEHLGQMGFSKEVVRRTCKELLKVYGGETAAWFFLEEHGYKVVLDALLPDQEAQPEDHPPALDFIPHEEPSTHIEAFNVGSSLDTVCGNAMQLPLGDGHEQGDGEYCMHPNDDHSIRIRPPCYGWLSEDEDDIVHRTQPMVQSSLSFRGDRKRKTRWDVKSCGN